MNLEFERTNQHCLEEDCHKEQGNLLDPSSAVSNSSLTAGPECSTSRIPDRTSPGRLLRWKREHALLQAAIKTVIRSNPAIVLCGTDTSIEQSAKTQGFGRFDLVIVRALFGKWTVSIVCAPNRVWRNPKQLRKLLTVKYQAAAHGHRVVLVPASSIRNSKRHANAVMLASSLDIKPSRSERKKIIEHVLLNNGSSIDDCANLVRHHRDPLGVVLNLVAHRWLRLSPGPLSHHSVVSSINHRMS